MPHWTFDEIEWKESDRLPEEDTPGTTFIGRENILKDCCSAWGMTPDCRMLDDGKPNLHFRLEGSPGVGKNALVYELVRRARRHDPAIPFYMMVGHEEMTPEDLSLLIVPGGKNEEGEYRGFTLVASPLATAIRKGGIFFFDEINRVPERALSPLSSVLDERQHITSAMTSIVIGPESEVERGKFRFCCALNPSLGGNGLVLPDYIEQRTLPVFTVDPPGIDDLIEILKTRLQPDDKWLIAFRQLYDDESMVNARISVRQALALLNYALRSTQQSSTPEAVLQKALVHFMRIPRYGDSCG